MALYESCGMAECRDSLERTLLLVIVTLRAVYLLADSQRLRMGVWQSGYGLHLCAGGKQRDDAGKDKGFRA